MDREGYGRVAGRLIGLLFAAALLPGTAQALLIDVTVTGQVTRIVNSQLNSQFSIGQSMSATFTYDAATVPNPSLILTQLLYQGAIVPGGSATVGAYNATLGGGNINISNDDPTFFDSMVMRTSASGASIGTLSPVTFAVAMEDAAMLALNDLVLPQATADLAGFADRTWGLAFGIGIGTDPPLVGGRLTSLTLTPRPDVPEPSLPWLLAGGLAALVVRMRRTVG